MSLLAQAPVWHFWIGVLLFIPSVLLIVGLIIGYFVKVVRPKYPR